MEFGISGYRSIYRNEDGVVENLPNLPNIDICINILLFAKFRHNGSAAIVALDSNFKAISLHTGLILSDQLIALTGFLAIK